MSPRQTPPMARETNAPAVHIFSGIDLTRLCLKRRHFGERMSLIPSNYRIDISIFCS